MIATKGRIVLVRVQSPGPDDDGLRTAVVTGRDKKGICVSIFPDCARDPNQPPGLGPLLHRRSLTYGEDVWNWRWPRDEDHLGEMELPKDNDPEPIEEEPSGPEPEPEQDDGTEDDNPFA